MKKSSMIWIAYFGISLLLTACPMPTLLKIIEPPWILLLLFYLLIADEIMVLFSGLLISSFLLDAIQVSLLGQHLLALVLSLWVAKFKLSRFVYYSLNQQSVLLGVVVAVYELIFYGVDALLGASIQLTWALTVIGCSVMSGVSWVWVSALGQCVIPKWPLRSPSVSVFK